MFISDRLSNRHIFLLPWGRKIVYHVCLQVRELCSSESSRCIFHESCSLVTFGHRIGDIWFALWSWENLRRVSAISGFFTLLLFIHTIYTIRIMMVSRCTRYHDHAIVSFTLDSFTIILILTYRYLLFSPESVIHNGYCLWHFSCLVCHEFMQ